MTVPSDIPADIYQWAADFWDANLETEQVEMVARAYMAGQGAGPQLKRGGLTAHQRDALGFISGYIAENSCSPSMEDIRKHFGLTSKSAAHRVVSELVKRGAIATLPRKSRSITIVGRA